MAHSGPMMEQDLVIILAVFGFFLLTGIFGMIGIYSIFQQKKKRAMWSFGIGFVMIAAYLLLMFGSGFVTR
ncbi:hypothetical protein [Halalkalibacter oceani]|uniref:Uncharacterized protein n=1 Tax=Halalkalibacter oceani TaxID=1653776 RepID=A0A9X2DMH6_9BACI|nr:hypothetical protein [Halalkalibacter oceani]MCM3713516.1 hypothetical protein [Halalkalibacter oceani]